MDPLSPHDSGKSAAGETPPTVAEGDAAADAATQASTGSDPALPKLLLAHSSGAAVEIYLQGAHVASWRLADGEDVLFMSRESRLESGVPIRGGIPVVFPQFSKRGPLPQHGLVRTVAWELAESGMDASGAVFARLLRTDTEATRELWPHAFLAELLVTLDAGLSATLRVTNTGDQPFTFTSALHTYYRVGDVRTVSVQGLEGSHFLGVAPDGEPVDVLDPLWIQRETDGVYTDVSDRLCISDPSLDRTMVIEKEGFADAVVWNPWIERARDMPDFGDEEYLTMLCVEPANIAVPTHLLPGQDWSGTQRIWIENGA